MAALPLAASGSGSAHSVTVIVLGGWAFAGERHRPLLALSWPLGASWLQLCFVVLVLVLVLLLVLALLPASSATGASQSTAHTYAPGKSTTQHSDTPGVNLDPSQGHHFSASTCHRNQQKMVIRIGGIGRMRPIFYLAV